MVWSDDWSPLRRELGEAYRTSAPDLGFFEPQVEREPIWHPDALAARVTAEMSSVTVLIGHSLGCRVVLQVACDRPVETRAIVLIEGSSLAEMDPEVLLRPIAHDASAFMEVFFGQMIGPKMPDLQGRALIERAKAMPAARLADVMKVMLRWDRKQGPAALAAL